ncbi:MAG: hypothetical protein KR126chlam6_00037 [Candidatus Anoxychlamydiales bacterium]|nr:hypothetical protein [Candidatus Anoxychlamydiales bacterium]
MLECLNFNQPVSSLFNSCLREISTKASSAIPYTTDIITKTANIVRSIPNYIAYSPEGAKYMRYANTLIPGLLFVCSGVSFYVYARKTDSKSQKIAAYLLAAATTVYGIAQIVDYLDISSCIGKEIQIKKSEFENMFKNEPLPTTLKEDSFKVKYNFTTQQPEYSFKTFIPQPHSRRLFRHRVAIHSNSSRCF